MSSASRSAAGFAALFLSSVGLALCARAGVPGSPSLPVPTPLAPPQVSDVPVNVDPGDFLALQRRYVTLFQQTHSAVVKINALVNADTKDGQPSQFVWTGFFISRSGYILTAQANYLQNAARVRVEHEGIFYVAEVVGLDTVTNLALLKVSTLPKQFGVLDLTDSAELPALGSQLLAVTCKQDQPPGPAAGMLLGYNTNYADHLLPTLYLRVNIPDDGGEGGSPVFDLQGRLAGIMIVQLPGSRSSLVLPARAALRVREDLLNNGQVAYGSLGFDTEQPPGDPENGVRVLVSSVDYGGPAQSAGLSVHDQLLSIGGVTVHTIDDFRQAKFFARPGQFINVRVRRDGKDIDLTLRVDELPIAAPPAPPAASPATTAAKPPAGTAAIPASVLDAPNANPASNLPNETDRPPPPVIDTNARPH